MLSIASNSLEIWLLPNRRALWLGMIVPILGAALGAWLALTAGPPVAESQIVEVRIGVGVVLAVVSGIIAGTLIKHMGRPRIAYRDCQLLFYLQSAMPIAVPVDVVEAFFVGQQPLDVAGGSQGSHASMNLVARLSQRATEWSQRDVKPALGRWADGYVTIHGAWCEPITADLIRHLNHRLREIHDARKSDNLNA